MSTEPLRDDQLSELAIFPLHGVALFPNTVVPLHVFEPRYRKLVEDCLHREEPLAVWQLDPGAGTTPFGPGIHAVATAGRIAVHHRLPDGRYNVVVEGLERVRLVEEVDAPTPYRKVWSRRHPLAAPDDTALASRVEALRAIARTLTPVHPRAARLLEVNLRRFEDFGPASDVLCAVTFDDAGARQRLLEQSDVVARLDHVIDSLARTLLRDLPDVEPAERC